MKANTYLTGLALLAISLLVRFLFAWPDTRLHYIQCDVGQGDAILLTRQFDQILIDSGPDEAVLECLQKYIPFWDKHLDIVVASHPDKDHIGGFKNIFDHYQVDTLIWNGVESQELLWKNLQDQGQGIRFIPAATVKNIQLEMLKLEFLWPNQKIIESALLEDNDVSVVTKITYGQFTALLTGDISTLVESLLIPQNQDLKSLVLKISHHGSKTASSHQFLTEVEPVIATIGVGKNSYGHPAPEVLEKLKKLQIKYLRTDQRGNIELVTDGKEMVIRD